MKIPLYFKQVIILFLLTIIGPHALGVLRWQCSLELDGQSWQERYCWIGATLLSVMCAPFFILYQKFYFIYLEMKMNADPNNRTVIKKWEETKQLLNSHIRLELFYSKQYTGTPPITRFSGLYHSILSNKFFQTKNRIKTLYNAL